MDSPWGSLNDFNHSKSEKVGFSQKGQRKAGESKNSGETEPEIDQEAAKVSKPSNEPPTDDSEAILRKNHSAQTGCSHTFEGRRASSRRKKARESMTKDEARKRMMSWRKTTRPRVSLEIEERFSN